jgi:hypothetical protein
MLKSTRFLAPTLAVMCSVAFAARQDCTTQPGAAVGDGPVSAEAVFTTGEGFISITLSNLQADPRSAGQLLNGVAFTLSEGQTSGSLGPNSANLRQVKSGGVFTDFGPSSTGWALASDSGAGLRLCVLCSNLGAAGPSHLLIGAPAGSGRYASANGSIAGNRPHNPFTAESATFLVYVPGLTESSTVTSVTFFFGTQDGITAPGFCGGTPVLE